MKARINIAFKNKNGQIITRTYGHDRIIKFNASKEDRCNHDSIQYGLSSQYGDIELLEKDAEFRILNENAQLQDGLDISIEVCKQENSYIPIGCYKSQNWRISDNELSVQVNLIDALESLRGVRLNKYNLNELNALMQLNQKSLTAELLLQALLKIGGLAHELVYRDTVSRLHIQRIWTADLFLARGTVFDMIKRLLQSLKMRMYIGARQVNGRIEPSVIVYKAD